MALSQRLQVRQVQSLVMTPQLQQAIKLLQMSNLELSAYVEEQLVENPMLEARDQAADTSDFDDEPQRETREAAPLERDSADVLGEDAGFGRQLEASDTNYANVWDDGSVGGGEAGGESSGLIWENRGGTGGPGDSASDGQGWEAYTESPVSLREHLEAQIGEEFPDPIIRRVAILIADQLDVSGYFIGDFAELAYLLGVSQQAVADVHQRFLQFDPPGIGARSLSECMAIQLQEMGALDAPMRCLLDQLALIGKGDFQRLARLCGTDLSGLSGMMERLKSCAPRPAAAFDHEPVVTVIPDVFVRRAADGGWNIELNAEALPQVLASRTYYATIRRQARGVEAMEFVTEQWQSANWLVKALDQRANTILKTATAIVESQDRFFEEGISGLRPMTLRDVAEAIGMHESTVSRVTNGKYVSTPRGVLELKFFFSTAIANAGGADAHSAEAVRHRLRQLIEAETIANVLSDEKLVELLEEEGVTVARRTVAKYREGMNIPTSSRRRRLLKLAAG
jgi:RNA polymerase sigma-54 factor